MFSEDYIGAGGHTVPDTALVTGTAGGIGAAIVVELRRRGVTVIGVDRERPTTNGEDYFIRADLAAVDPDELIAKVISTVGNPPDILVNCAGINIESPAEHLRRTDLDSVLAVNLIAPVGLSIAAGRHMLEREYGRIVNITSIHGRAGAAGCLSYDASKAALDNATRTLAAEWSRRGVLVNALAPGFVSTAMCTEERTAEPWFTEGYVANGRLPMGRPAAPDEIARPVAWLASRENTYITGQVVYADGGLYSTF